MRAPDNDRRAGTEVPAGAPCPTGRIVDGLMAPAIGASRVVEDCFG